MNYPKLTLAGKMVPNVNVPAVGGGGGRVVGQVHSSHPWYLRTPVGFLRACWDK